MSVQFALQRIGFDSVVTDDKKVIKSADRVIFPGVGEAGTTMKYLNRTGLGILIPQLSQPVLGICLGLQLMCKHSEERDTNCLEIFENKVLRFKPVLNVPHMGWNSLSNLKSPLFKGISEGSYVYFVHSYFAEISDKTIAACNYINNFSAALHKDNFYATQFHPEKSGETGERILNNFIKLS